MATVLITGCATGIGRATVDAFASAGWQVAATVRKPEDAAILDELERVRAYVVDVRDAAGVRAAVDDVVDRTGSLDVAVNNAGTSYLALFEETPPDALREAMDVNYYGAVNVIKAALPHMRARRQGTLISVTSLAGIVGVPMNSFYAASKFALEGLSETLALELAPMGISVKIVQPGPTRTGIHAKWAGQPIDALPDYDEYRAWLPARMAASSDPASMQTSEHVASVILGAATDSTTRLRYPASPAVQALVDARHALPPDEFLEALRDRFLGGAPPVFARAIQ